VFDDKVFVSGFQRLEAYDLAGLQGCGGTPTTCEPLWVAPWAGSPAFAYGDRIYDSGLQAFDPDGVEGCSGVPVVCEPLNDPVELGGFGATPANGEIYVAGARSTTGVTAFDDDVLSGCADPCAPLRTYESGCVSLNGICELAPFAIEGDRLVMLVNDANGSTQTGLLAGFDRTGSTGCTGTPVVCAPAWSEWLGGGEVAMQDGAVVAAVRTLVEDPFEEEPPVGTGRLLSMDPVTGASNWSGLVDAPDAFYSGWVGAGGGTVFHLPDSAGAVRIYPLDSGSCTIDCAPARVADFAGGAVQTPPIAANGLLFVASTGGIQVFSLAGASGCAGTPVVCTPLATLTAPGATNFERLVVAGGKVVAVDADHDLHVFGLA
jgi:hypothetical protein